MMPAMWNCPNCAARVEHEGEVCRSCGTARPALAGTEALQDTPSSPTPPTEAGSLPEPKPDLLPPVAAPDVEVRWEIPAARMALRLTAIFSLVLVLGLLFTAIATGMEVERFLSLLLGFVVSIPALGFCCFIGFIGVAAFLQIVIKSLGQRPHKVPTSTAAQRFVPPEFPAGQPQPGEQVTRQDNPPSGPRPDEHIRSDENHP
jgi:hypothetical protein